jgi:hypothetical protein
MEEAPPLAAVGLSAVAAQAASLARAFEAGAGARAARGGVPGTGPEAGALSASRRPPLCEAP